jgi:D-sedoheptulose 7-phosphate isomerase
MSIRDSLNDSIAVIGILFQLEEPLTRAAGIIRETLLSGHKVLVCGNGGSAADSSHLAAELTCRLVSDRRAYPALCLAWIQEAHKVIIHLLCEIVEPDLAQ